MAKPIILAVNAGSSSIKYSVYEKTSSNSVRLTAAASISGLTAPPSKFTYSLYDPSGKDSDAFKYFVDFLTGGKGREKEEQVLDLKTITVVCHRIVHGGPEPEPLIITEDELHHLDALSDLAPLYSLSDMTDVDIIMQRY